MNETELRKAICRLASSRRTRVVPRSKEMPCDWRPTQITNPVTNTPYTEEGAWALIVERVEAGEPIEAIRLEQPPDKIGYVMNFKIAEGRPNLYVKVQLSSSSIVGRSFHPSERKN